MLCLCRPRQEEWRFRRVAFQNSDIRCPVPLMLLLGMHTGRSVASVLVKAMLLIASKSRLGSTCHRVFSVLARITHIWSLSLNRYSSIFTSVVLSTMTLFDSRLSKPNSTIPSGSLELLG